MGCLLTLQLIPVYCHQQTEYPVLPCPSLQTHRTCAKNGSLTLEALWNQGPWCDFMKGPLPVILTHFLLTPYLFGFHQHRVKRGLGHNLLWLRPYFQTCSWVSQSSSECHSFCHLLSLPNLLVSCPSIIGAVHWLQGIEMAKLEVLLYLGWLMMYQPLSLFWLTQIPCAPAVQHSSSSFFFICIFMLLTMPLLTHIIYIHFPVI